MALPDAPSLAGSAVSEAARIERLTVAAYTLPTDFPESDGTLEWNATTMVLVQIFAGGKWGLGFSYADTATATPGAWSSSVPMLSATRCNPHRTFINRKRAATAFRRNQEHAGLLSSKRIKEIVMAVDTSQQTWPLPAYAQTLARELSDAIEGEIPLFADKTFVAWFANRLIVAPNRPKVILWPDTFTNHFLPDTGKAAVEVLDSGCCGMAGAFGFQKEKYEISIAIGERVLLPAVRNAHMDVLLIADGFSCREQIRQSTGRQALHLAEVLQMALRQRNEGGNENPGTPKSPRS